MFWETLERVNRLRQEAMANPEFVQSAKEHEKALNEQELIYCHKTKRRVKKPKTLADIYQQSEFGTRTDVHQH
ncbi:hypothetical protein LZU85_05640 [Vibrio sp. IRLE0018]|uniref:hypothetical protein n=1 Tax=Vibrio floridensis TaxID=2908007 RepID=UPI001A30725C|nr:hypothetical protein [Vibrio floridensis]MCF8778275.1 hypothetical protein [Vibrio floridensis]HAS6348537.1 hypothetical protein [Vibrio vulnificus]